LVFFDVIFMGKENFTLTNKPTLVLTAGIAAGKFEITFTIFFFSSGIILTTLFGTKATIQKKFSVMKVVIAIFVVSLAEITRLMVGNTSSRS